MTDKVVRIATRQSPLALWQAEYVKAELEKFHPGIKVELMGITTTGDALHDSPLSKNGGKGHFVKELQFATQSNDAEMAVNE